MQEAWEEEAVLQFNRLIMEPVKALRNLRVENKVPPSESPQAALITENEADYLRHQVKVISSLARLNNLEITDRITNSADLKLYPSVTISSSGMVAFLKLDTVAANVDKNRQLKKELANLEAQIQHIIRLLSSDFSKRAPAQIVEKEQQKLAGLESAANKIRIQLEK